MNRYYRYPIVYPDVNGLVRVWHYMGSGCMHFHCCTLTEWLEGDFEWPF